MPKQRKVSYAIKCDEKSTSTKLKYKYIHAPINIARQFYKPKIL